MINYKQHIDEITEDFDNKMFAEYLQGLWGIEAGYKTDALYLARLNYIIGTWQNNYDCDSALCIKSRGSKKCVTCAITPDSHLVSPAGGFGSSPFPQVLSSGCCTDGFKHHHISGDLL